jgi:hypothetical protein
VSGVAYVAGGFTAAMWTTTSFVVAAWLLSITLPPITAGD